jgi:hypothetical protein
VASQLWEVAIHRVRRSFEQTHGDNTFTAGDVNPRGIEVIVGGKNAGDRYCIANDVVTMVHRHIHGTVVTIETESVTDTGHGYLSHRYSSRYSDPATGEARGGPERGVAVLRERQRPLVLIDREARDDSPFGRTPFQTVRRLNRGSGSVRLAA